MLSPTVQGNIVKQKINGNWKKIVEKDAANKSNLIGSWPKLVGKGNRIVVTINMDIIDKDGKDSIESRIIDSEQKTETCTHAPGFEGQKDSSISSDLSNHIDEPLADCSEQPSDHSDLDFEYWYPRHNPSLHHQTFETIPDDSQGPVNEKEYRTVACESSQEHDEAMANTKTELKVTSGGKINHQIDLPKKEVKTFVVEKSNQEHFPKTEVDPLGVIKSSKNTSAVENKNQEHLPTSELQTPIDDLSIGIASSIGEEEKDGIDTRTTEAEFQSRSTSTSFGFWWIIPLLLIFLLHHNNLEMTNIKFPVPPILYLSSKITKTGRPVVNEYSSNGNNKTEYCSNEKFEYFMKVSCKQNYWTNNMDNSSMKYQLKVKTMVNEFFGRYLDSNCQFQYMSSEKLHLKKCHSKHNFLFEKMKYLSNTCNITAYAVIWMPTDDSIPPHEDNVLIPSTQEHAVRHTEGVDPIINAIIPGTVQSVIDSCNVTTTAIKCTEGPQDIPDVITQSTGESFNVTTRPVQCTEGLCDIPNVITQRSTGESSDIDTRAVHITDGYWDTPSGTIQRARGSCNVTTTPIQCTEGPLDIPDVITQSTGESSDADPRAVHITDGYCDIHAGTIHSAGGSCNVTITAIQCTDRPREIPAGMIQMGAACTWRSLEGEMSMSSREHSSEGNSTTQRIEQSTNIPTFIRIPHSTLVIRDQDVCLCLYAAQANRRNLPVMPVERSVNSTFTTIPQSHNTTNSRQETSSTCNPVTANRSTVSTVTMVPGTGVNMVNIESNPVRMNEQPVGADDLANIIQRLCQRSCQHRGSILGSILRSAPIAGQHRPDMCSPDTVATILTLAVALSPEILDDFRTRDFTGLQVLEIVRNFLEHNHVGVTTDIRRIVRERYGESGDIYREADVVSAVMGDTKIEEVTTCTNTKCHAINTRIIDSSLSMFNRHDRRVLTSKSLAEYLNQHLMRREETCSQCSGAPAGNGTRQSRRIINSRLIYVNAFHAKISKANIKDMLSPFRVGDSVYQVHALSFWNDHHFTARINIRNQWWTYDNKTGFNEQEDDDDNPGLLSGIYIKKIR
ncbi:unnamed protein product [Mytilus coruscus]|uniref:USP domain-containing protein n=1 Tax=Mytilus coruscus TaxID=42192 RepID=A0A6J8D198_MYTCO|nr:unnamed protein product [Mytilus coruscus]